jgi:hypothetical protein
MNARPIKENEATPQRSAETPTERAAKAVERMLRPIVRLLVGRVACIYVIDRMRRLYLEEARAWLDRTQPGQRVTRSKLAVLTGLDTRTIAAMENDPDHASLLADEVCAYSVVLDRWANHGDFHDDEGRPAILVMMGPGKTFQALTARAVGRNITVHTILDHLLESGNVALDADQTIRLVDPVYSPIKPSEQVVLDAGSHSIARLAKTVGHNMDAISGKATRIQQDRFTARVPADRYDELEARTRALLEEHIQAMDDLLAEYEFNGTSSDRAAGGADHDGKSLPAMRSIGVGWYVFE